MWCPTPSSLTFDSERRRQAHPPYNCPIAFIGVNEVKVWLSLDQNQARRGFLVCLLKEMDGVPRQNVI